MTPNRSLLLILLTCATSACYTREPLQTLPPPVGVHVVAQLTDSGTVAMGNAIGNGALEVEGIVTSATESSWSLAMLRVQQRGERTIEWNHEPVTFPSTYLARPVVVTLDKKKSWLAAGGITVGALVLARAFNFIGADDSKDDTPAPQQYVGFRIR